MQHIILYKFKDKQIFLDNLEMLSSSFIGKKFNLLMSESIGRISGLKYSYDAMPDFKIGKEDLANAIRFPDKKLGEISFGGFANDLTKLLSEKYFQDDTNLVIVGNGIQLEVVSHFLNGNLLSNAYCHMYDYEKGNVGYWLRSRLEGKSIFCCKNTNISVQLLFKKMKKDRLFIRAIK